MAKTPTFIPAGRDHAQLWLILLWLACRLPLALQSSGASFDMESYARVADALREGRELYGDPALAGRYPYGPLWAMLLLALDQAAALFGLARPLAFKLPGLAADFGILLLLRRLLGRLTRTHAAPGGDGRAFWGAAAWAASPLAGLISAGHGQFDAAPLFLLLLAAWYLEFSEHPRSDLGSALALGAAIALKTWPVFFLPLYLKSLGSRGERMRYLGLALGLPLALWLPFAAHAGFPAAWQAMAYGGASAFSLPEAFRAFFFAADAPPHLLRGLMEWWRALALALLSLLWLAYALGPWRFPLLAGLALAASTLLAFAPALSPQYLLWGLPFALLLPGRMAARHLLVVLPMLLVFYALFMPEVLAGPLAWAPPQIPSAFFLIWGLLNLGLWVFLLREWWGLLRLCLRPAGRLNFP